MRSDGRIVPVSSPAYKEDLFCPDRQKRSLKQDRYRINGDPTMEKVLRFDRKILRGCITAQIFKGNNVLLIVVLYGCMIVVTMNDLARSLTQCENQKL